MLRDCPYIQRKKDKNYRSFPIRKRARSKQWSEIFQVFKEKTKQKHKTCQPRILYPKNISLKMKEK